MHKVKFHKDGFFEKSIVDYDPAIGKLLLILIIMSLI